MRPTHPGWEKITYIFSVLDLHQDLHLDISIYKAPAGQIVEFRTTKDTSVPTNKNLAAEIVPHISSALRDISMIFDKSILFGSPKLVYVDPAGTL